MLCTHFLDEHVRTYENGKNRSQVHFLLVKMEILKECKENKVNPKESVVIQHRVTVVNMKWEKCKKVKCSSNELIEKIANFNA